MKSSPTLEPSASFYPNAIGPEITIDPSKQNPQIVFLGTLVSRNGHASLELNCAVDTTSGSGTLDIDYVVIHARDSDACAAVVNQVTRMDGYVSTIRLMAEHRLLDEPMPRMAISNGTIDTPIGYEGSPSLVTIGTTVATCWLATGGAQGAPDATSGGTRISPATSTT
jgi:hypothetical protein